MSNLFTNWAGYPTTRVSYSMLEDFKKCKAHFSLKRRMGWKTKDQTAAQEAGNAIEAAVQVYHEGGCKPGAAVDEGKRLWLLQKENKTLVYREKDGDWEVVYQQISEILALYEIKWRQFGYQNPRFQKSFLKEVFPGSELAGIDFIAYVDMLAELRTVGTAADPGTPVQVCADMKVSGSALSETDDILTLDPQLRSYAWVSGVPRQAFLWFQRKSTDSYKKGDEIYLLKDGSEAVVVKGGEFPITVSDPDGKNERMAAKGSVTKQKISFVVVRIPDEDLIEAGEQIGQTIAEIAAAERRKNYPKEPGIRWPNDKCKGCDLLGVCLGDDKLIDAKLIRPKLSSRPRVSKVVETDWLENL